MRLRHTITLGAVGGGLLLAAPGASLAATFCVHTLGSCAAGTTDSGSDLQQALTDAQGTVAADVVQIGPGTYTAPVNGFSAGSANPVAIVGSGDATILTGATTPVIDVKNKDLSSVHVNLTTASGTGVAASGGGTVDHVSVSGPATNATGINAAGATTIRDSTISVSSTGIFASVFQNATPTIRNDAVSATTAINANGHGATNPFFITGLSGHSRTSVLAAQSVVFLDNSVLQHDNGGGEALAAECNSFGSASLTVDHVTILGDGISSTALESSCFESGLSALLRLTNSTIRGVPSSTYRSSANGGTANVELSWSDVKVAPNGESGPGAVTRGAGMLTLVDPGFTSITDAHLVGGSALVDAGDPAAAGQAVDFDGQPRLSGARQDIGAYELQQAAPPAGAGGGSGGSGGTSTPGATPTPAAGVPAPPVSAPVARPVLPAPAPAAAKAPTTAQLRAGLLAAIRSGHGRGLLRYRWLAAGTVRFEWRAHGRVVGRGSVLRRSVAGASTGRVRVRLLGRIPAHTRVVVRASFTPTGGHAVSVSGGFTRAAA